MDRLSRFLNYQLLALRALLKPAPKAISFAWDDSERISHPSQLCRCNEGKPAHVLADHDRDCKWVAAMCEGCAGTGWCVRCGGEGTRPDWDPDKTAPQRPSALRIA